MGDHQGCHAGHLGDCRRGTGDGAVAATGGERVDAHAGGAEEHRVAVVRERRQHVVLVGGADAHDPTHSGRVGRRRRGVVAGGGNNNHTLRPGPVERILQRLRITRAGEAHQDHVGPMGDRVVDAEDDVEVLTGAGGTEHGDGHYRHTGVSNGSDPDPVTGLRSDDPGQRCAVTVRVGQTVRPIEDRRAGNHVAVDVDVGTVDAGVEHGHDRGARDVDDSVGEVPSDLGARPLVGILGVVRDAGDVAAEVLLDIDDARIIGELERLACGVLDDGELDDLDPERSDRIDRRTAGRLDRRLPCGCRRSGHEFDEIGDTGHERVRSGGVAGGRHRHGGRGGRLDDRGRHGRRGSRHGRRGGRLRRRGRVGSNGGRRGRVGSRFGLLRNGDASGRQSARQVRNRQRECHREYEESAARQTPPDRVVQIAC